MTCKTYRRAPNFSANSLAYVSASVAVGEKSVRKRTRCIATMIHLLLKRQNVHFSAPAQAGAATISSVSLRQLSRFRSLLLFAGFGKKRVGSILPVPG